MNQKEASAYDYDIDAIEKKMEMMSQECAEQMATQKKVKPKPATKPKGKKK